MPIRKSRLKWIAAVPRIVAARTLPERRKVAPQSFSSLPRTTPTGRFRGNLV